MGTTLVSSLKSQVIPFILSTVHTVHTLEPRVTVLVNVRPAQTCHTLAPRVTDLVTVRESLLCILQQSLFWSLSNQVCTTPVSSLCGHEAAVTAAGSKSRSKYSSHSSSGHGAAVMVDPVICSTISVPHSISNKRRNNMIKQINGNGRSSLIICHWNLGSKLWKNKRNQIQALVDLD